MSAVNKSMMAETRVLPAVAGPAWQRLAERRVTVPETATHSSAHTAANRLKGDGEIRGHNSYSTGSSSSDYDLFFIIN